MAYTDVISIESAKTYLGVDDTSRDDEICRMIGASLSLLERKTNIISNPLEKTYILKNGCVRVYDYPINTLDSELESTVKRTDMGMYSIFQDNNSAAKTITLNIGSINIPKEIEEAAYMLIEHFFNDKEGRSTNIPSVVQMIIDSNKRFII
jgi:hypothetical protein